MFKRIDHTEIIPIDYDDTLKFYTEVLGFTLEEKKKVDKPPMHEIAYLQLGDTILEVMAVTDPPPVSKEPWQVGFKRIALEVESMDKAVEYLKTKGIEMKVGPVNLGSSMRAEFEEINGLSIELREWFK
ncbi:VOC family protein [Chloroflexota bacterium]